MTFCNPDHRDTVESAADAIRDCQAAQVVTVCEPMAGQHNRWSLVILLQGRGVPAPVLSELAHYGLTERGSQPQGAYWECVAVVA
jgi:hypothetical protein